MCFRFTKQEARALQLSTTWPFLLPSSSSCSPQSPLLTLLMQCNRKQIPTSNSSCVKLVFVCQKRDLGDIFWAQSSHMYLCCTLQHRGITVSLSQNCHQLKVCFRRCVENIFTIMETLSL